MKTQDMILLLLLVLVAVLVFVRLRAEPGGLGGLLGPDATPIPSICGKIAFGGLLPADMALRQVDAVDADGDGLDECVVLHYLVGVSDSPVVGAVYDFAPVEMPAGDLKTYPVADMRRYELKTDQGMQVRLGWRSDAGASLRVLAIDADTAGGVELVILDHSADRQLVGLAVFRWRAPGEGYQLVGYVRGDWLETTPGPIVHYFDQVVVCDRRYPVDANSPEMVVQTAFVWKGGELVLDPAYHSRGCAR